MSRQWADDENIASDWLFFFLERWNKFDASIDEDEKASRRSERSEYEERRWLVLRDLENYATRKTRRPTHKRLECSDQHPPLRNVNVAIDLSSAEHRNWWRWNVKYFERKEIASYTWRSTTHQQNFLNVYGKVESWAAPRTTTIEVSTRRIQLMSKSSEERRGRDRT